MGDGGGQRGAWRWVEAGALVAVPAVLVVAMLVQGSWALGTLAVVLAAVLVMALGWERRTPALRQLLPTVALGSAAAAGRVAFAAVPDVKPVSAIVILCGSLLGPQSGFLCGALAALLSNLFFGQGPWTPWQMYAWGLMGYGAGLLGRCLEGRAAAGLYGFCACWLYGWLLDAYTLVGYVRPITWVTALAAFAASALLDLTHAVATVAFIQLFWGRWRRALERVLVQHGLREPRPPEVPRT